MFQSQRNISDIKELSEESKHFWDKMLIFKQRFKDHESRTRSLEKNLAEVNFELSLVKNENSRLNEKLEEQGSKIKKYQQILKDLVEVEDRYCKLVVEKKKTDEELSSEKKLRVELQNKWNSEKTELQKSLHDELHILKEDSAAKENILKNGYLKMIEEQKAEIHSLNQLVSDAHKKKEEEVSKVKEDMIKAQREISRLKNRPCGQEKLTIVNNVTLKPIVQEGMIGTIIQAGEEIRGVEMTTSKSLEYVLEEQPLEEGLDSRTYTDNQRLEVPGHTSSRRSILPSHSRINASQNNVQHDSEPPGGRKCNALDVFRIPSRIQKKSPLRKKRKLYSRTDDTV